MESEKYVKDCKNHFVIGKNYIFVFLSINVFVKVSFPKIGN